MSQHNGTCRKTHCKSALEKNYSLQKSRETKKTKNNKTRLNLAINSSKN